jgi:hypothetical protein
MSQKGHFPENWKLAKILMIVNSGKETTSDPTSYRPISLLNTEGNILEKILMKRITHHLHKTDALSDKQYGFTPQRNTVDAAMEVKQYLEPHLEKGGVAITVSLYI